MHFELKDRIRYRSGAKDQVDYEIWFVAGNPGLISYYDQFLGLLHDSVNGELRGHGITAAVGGSSLGGFEVNRNASYSKFLTLEDEIEYIERQLADVALKYERKPKIILVGHSLGAYLILCLLERHKKALRVQSPTYDLLAGVLTFPTVIDLAKSKGGLRAAWLVRVPGFYIIVQMFAWLLTLLTWPSWRRRIITKVTPMPQDAAKVTSAFLSSPWGVAQSMYLLREEMKHIDLDKWGDDVWGAVEPAADVEKTADLYFFFGEDDHWCTNKSRGTIIASRGTLGGQRRPGRSVMEIDDQGIPHSFPLNHSRPVAAKVHAYIMDIIKRDSALSVTSTLGPKLT